MDEKAILKLKVGEGLLFTPEEGQLKTPPLAVIENCKKRYKLDFKTGTLSSNKSWYVIRTK